MPEEIGEGSLFIDGSSGKEDATPGLPDMTPYMVRISRAFELGDTFILHDAHILMASPVFPKSNFIKSLRPKENFVYIRVAPMRVDTMRLQMMINCLHKLAKAGVTTRIHFSGSFEDADAKGWFEPDKPWRRSCP